VGDPFLLDWPPYGIQGAVFRVTRPNYGTLLDGVVEIEAVEDHWRYTGLAYRVPDDQADAVPCGPLDVILGAPSAPDAPREA
jgi:hypothetical protein